MGKRGKLSGERLLGTYLAVIVLFLLLAAALPYFGAPPSSSVPSADVSPIAANEEEEQVKAEGEGEAVVSIDLKRANAGEASLPTITQAGTVDPTSLNGASSKDENSRASGSAASLQGIDFELGESGGATSSGRPVAGDRIEVRKQVFSRGARLGPVDVTIDKNARLFIRGADIKSILASSGDTDAAADRIGSNELVSFQRLRELGIDLRYDPVADQIELQPG